MYSQMWPSVLEFLPYRSLVTLRPLLDGVMKFCHSSCCIYIFFTLQKVTIMQVVQYGVMEQHRVLKANENTYQMLHTDRDILGLQTTQFLNCTTINFLAM